MNRIIKLTGDFSKTHGLMDACQAVEDARRERDVLEHGSAEWHDANKTLKEANQKHNQALRGLKK
jgi:hypothetical protein